MWTFNGIEITNELYDKYCNEGIIGFVYLLTLPCGLKYIGKKLWVTKRKMKPLKGTKKTRSKIVATDWESYYGSSEYFNEMVLKCGKENVKREILHLCKNKSEESYWETWEIFNRHALLREDYANGWVSARIHKNNVFAKIRID